MKKLMVAALAVAAIGANIAFAEEDDGIVSAAPAIADPINPKQGMLAKAYQLNWHSNLTQFKSMSTLQNLSKTPAVCTYADTNADFSKTSIKDGTSANVIRWEGFMKCKLAGTYTFTFSGKGLYSFYVNGRQYIDSNSKQTSSNVPLKVGFNKIVVVSSFKGRGASGKLSVGYRPKDSVSDPRPLAPADLYYDKPVEAEW